MLSTSTAVKQPAHLNWRSRFGASAPGETVLREYGFTVDNVCARAKALLS
jgi:transketolase